MGICSLGDFFSSPRVYAEVNFFDFARGRLVTGGGGMRLLPEPVDSRDATSDLDISRLGFSVLGVEDPVAVRVGDVILVGEDNFSSLVTASLMDRKPVTLALACEKNPKLPEGLGVAFSLDASLPFSSSLVGLAAIALRGVVPLGSSLVTTGVT